MSRNKNVKTSRVAEPEVEELDQDVVADDTEDVEPEEPTVAQAMVTATEQVGKAVEALAKNQQPRKLGVHERQIRSPHNPKGIRGRRFIRNGVKAHLWVNMVPVMPHLAGDPVFELLPRLQQGAYIGGRVSVTEVKTGSDTNVYITYPDTKEEQVTNKGEWRSFEHLLERCVTEGPMTAAQIASAR